MTEKDCLLALAHIVTHRSTHADIRGGKIPLALRTLLPDLRDLEGFRYAINVANEVYIRMDPQKSSEGDRMHVQAIFGEKVAEYIERTYRR